MANEQTIANLIIKLSAQTVEMAAGLKKAEGMLESFKGKAQAILGGITLTAIGYKFAKGILDAKNYAAEISKVAEKIGISTVDLSKLADVAQDVGLPLETLARGIRFLERSMLEASQAEGEHREIFRALGVEFEKSPGQVRPAIDVILDLSDAFMKMGKEDPTKAPLAMKLMGRGAVELIPLLDKGKQTLTEWMQTSEKTGMVISEGLGRRAREFNRTMHNVGDAIKGISLTILADMMPALQSASKFLLDLAERMNKLREHSALVSESLRYMAAIAFPLAIAAIIQFASKAVIAIAASAAIQGALDSIMFARAIGGFSSLGLAIANVSYIIRHFAVAVLGPALLNPITWVLVALAGLSVAWVALGKGARDAAREQERFADSVRSMKIDELRETLRDISIELAFMEQRYRAMVDEMERSGSVELDIFSVGTAAEADKAKKQIDGLKERIKILQGAIADVNKEKIAPPVLTPEEALKKLTAKIGEVRSQIVGLGDSTAGAKAALEAFIAETVRGVPMTGQLAAAVRQLRLEFGLYAALQQARANLAAREKGDLSISAAANEAAMADLKRNYDQGLVDVSSYYQQRRDLIRQAVDEEIAALERESERPGVTQARKIEITAEIKVKRTKEAQELADETREEADAFKELFATMTQGGMEQLVAENDLSLAQLQASYEDGLVSTREFFDERRRIIQENAAVEIGAVEAQIPGMDPKAAEEAKNKIVAIRMRMFSEMQKIGRDEVLQVRQNELEKFNIRAAFAQLKADAATGDLDRLRAQQEAEMEELDRQHAEQLRRIQESKEELILVDGEYLTKKEALEKAQFDQAMVRLKTQVSHERAVLQLRLQMASQVATGMQEIFGTLYEVSGKKIKAFFYLEKAAAIANAIINTAQGVTKALAQGGIFGPAMAGIIMATGAAQIALITAQTIKGFVKGGPVISGSGRKDDVPAMLTKGEYVQPEPVVRYYGVDVMEKIRRRVFPKEMFQGFGFFPVTRPQFAYATGGQVTGGGVTNSILVGPINVNDPRLASDLRSGIEETVVRILKDHHR